MCITSLVGNGENIRRRKEMKDILLARCIIEEMGELSMKYCFWCNEKYYDIKTLSAYDVYDGDNGVIQAEFLNENELKLETKESLNVRKKDLINRLKFDCYGVF